MHLRIMGPAAIALLAWSGRVAAQRPALEVGGFIQWTAFDNSLRIDDFFTPGVQIHVPLVRSFAVEADIARASTNGPPAVEVTYLPIHARLMYVKPVRQRITALVGAGYVHNRYGASRDGSDNGFTGLMGVRFGVTDQIGLRLDALADYMPSPANTGPTVGRNWNLGIRQGLSFTFGRRRSTLAPIMPMAPAPMPMPAPAPAPAPPPAPTPPADSDGDGVQDQFDRCPDTRAGTTVDAAGCVLDSDSDGVPDRTDRCPNTPAKTTVDATGCPLDSDQDGVPDRLDRCPNTPAGTHVDAAGCLVLFDKDRKALVLEGVNFANGKAELTEESKTILDNVATSLVANDSVRVQVEGHTSSTGTRALNLRLSQARAEAVKDYLVGRGVAANRLAARGFGPDRPIATNATPEGQAKNRRVALVKLD